jgi:hypothetical protein
MDGHWHSSWQDAGCSATILRASQTVILGMVEGGIPLSLDIRELFALIARPPAVSCLSMVGEIPPHGPSCQPQPSDLALGILSGRLQHQPLCSGLVSWTDGLLGLPKCLSLLHWVASLRSVQAERVATWFSSQPSYGRERRNHSVERQPEHYLILLYLLCASRSTLRSSEITTRCWAVDFRT